MFVTDIFILKNNQSVKKEQDMVSKYYTGWSVYCYEKKAYDCSPSIYTKSLSPFPSIFSV